MQMMSRIDTTLIKNIDIEYSIHYIEICKNIIANLRNESQDTYHLLLHVLRARAVGPT